jgi:hypothetical protein
VNLAEYQALFHAAITKGGSDPRLLEERFAGTPSLPAADRLRIHGEMWFWRQREALEAEFPALAACLGPEPFSTLCRDYLGAHPSDHHDIGRLGRALAEFLRLHPPPGRTDLGDLAALEWARSEVFFEAEAAAVDREAIRALEPERFARARIRFVPALRLLQLAHPAHELWARATGGGPGTPVPPGATWLVIWRPEHDVFHSVLDRHEALALREALGGASLLDVCARFAAVDEPVTVGFTALASWIDEGWVAAIEQRPAP